MDISTKARRILCKKSTSIVLLWSCGKCFSCVCAPRSEIWGTHKKTIAFFVELNVDDFLGFGFCENACLWITAITPSWLFWVFFLSFSSSLSQLAQNRLKGRAQKELKKRFLSLYNKWLGRKKNEKTFSCLSWIPSHRTAHTQRLLSLFLPHQGWDFLVWFWVGKNQSPTPTLISQQPRENPEIGRNKEMPFEASCLPRCQSICPH